MRSFNNSAYTDNSFVGNRFSINRRWKWKWISHQGLPRGNQNEIIITLSVFGPQKPSILNASFYLQAFCPASWFKSLKESTDWFLRVLRRMEVNIRNTFPLPYSDLLGLFLFQFFAYTFKHTSKRTNMADTISPVSQINLRNFILRPQ